MGTPIFDFPSLIAKKFVTGDYVGDLYLITKSDANPTSGGTSRQMCEM